MEKKKPTPIVGTPKGEPVTVEMEEPTVIEGLPEGEPVNVKLDSSQGPQKMEGTPGGMPVAVSFKKSGPHIKAERQAQTASEAETILRTDGQRKVNLTWEYTQAATTVLITGAAIYCAVNGIEADVLNFAFIAVISTYYTRTNHTKVGGVGPNWSGR